MDEFNRSLGKILVSEGGFTNNLKNPGGATNRGVTQRVYNEDRMSRGLSAQSVQLITDVEIADICNELTLTTNHCSVLLYRARTRLRTCLSEKGLTTEDAAGEMY